MSRYHGSKSIGNRVEITFQASDGEHSGSSSADFSGILSSIRQTRLNSAEIFPRSISPAVSEQNRSVNPFIARNPASTSQSQPVASHITNEPSRHAR